MRLPPLPTGADLSVRGTVRFVTAVYVASPLGFSEPGRHYLAEVLHPRLARAGWAVLDPWADQTGAWAAAHHTPVVGWRSDFRLADHEAAPVNLQVEDFVLVSGGGVVTTLDEAITALDGLRKNWPSFSGGAS